VTVSKDVVASRLDRALRPLHRWIWSDAGRRARKLLSFAETEADGGRDLARAAELTSDPLLRRLYLRHACDEQRHAELFRGRALAILAELPAHAGTGAELGWIAPGERGLDDLRIDKEADASLLAFLHLSEKAAAGRFAIYREVLGCDAATRDVFGRVLRDEAFHMNYTRSQLARVAPERHRARLWRARAARLWKAYLRIATALAGIIGKVLLIAQYFVILPVFALLARRAARREPAGWCPSVPRARESLKSPYG
jgi:hypothetical protein